MDLSTSGRFRVLGRPREPTELLLIDAEECDPVYVGGEGYDGALAETVAELEAGYLVDAALAWDDGTPRFESVDVLRRTKIEFVDGVTGMFEAARETWAAADAAGEAMNSRVTRNTDGDPNGVLYVFAEQSGARDVFAEFESGLLPLEPLIARANEGLDDDGDRAVFVMRPTDEPFVAVYIAFDGDGLLARTVRETYGV
ncbi:DUF6663 family protein [Halegenticoccus tardaugens]|uniref:DUF6663 family protein n=1 Tax=Halegenticoccus tardaugens TaxID=2071624 RepID=UPI00100BBD95|nr:DUF6663 family protein [Halegenticoccus tardaugens]